MAWSLGRHQGDHYAADQQYNQISLLRVSVTVTCFSRLRSDWYARGP